MNIAPKRRLSRKAYFVQMLILLMTAYLNATVFEDAKFFASDGAANDLFGTSVSISGNLAIVGSIQDDDAGSNSGSAYIFANTTGNTWTQQAKITASDAAVADGFGVSVGISGNIAIVGSRYDDDAGSSSGSAYIFVNTAGNTWVQQAKITASDADINDQFGFSVAISDNIVIVGAYQNDDGGSNSGSAYIFANTTGSTWTQQAKVIDSNAAANDQFGYSVSISGNIAIVGSYFDESGIGSAFLYANTTGNTWEEQARITGSDEDDQFGYSVAISGNTVIVGARNDDDGASNSGAAYIFSNTSGNTWVQQTKITASDPDSNEYFGETVGISDNVVIVGSQYNDDTGSAYIYANTTGNTWFPITKISASDASSGDVFGRHVAISGNTVIIGAPNDDDAGDASGSAYIKDENFSAFISSSPALTFDVDKTVLISENSDQANITVTLSKPLSSDFSGNFLLSGTASTSEGIDYTLSGTGLSLSSNIFSVTLPAGVTSTNITMTANSGDAFRGSREVIISILPGSGYNYSPVEKTLKIQETYSPKLFASDAESNDQFGQSVAISGNVAIVGSYQDDDGGSSSGSAYIFANTTGNTWTQQTKITASDAASNDRFGYSVAISGNITIIGAYQDDDGGSNSGSAYIFANTTGNTWTQQTKITASDPDASDSFGYSVAVSDNIAIVGAYQDDDDGSSSGSAYIYANTTGNTWVQQAKITASDADSSDRFGYSVAISGNIVIVGAYQDDDVESTSGSTYIYANTTGNTWVQQTKITASDPGNGDRFGESVAISGNIVIVGTQYDDDGGSSSGSAYIYANTTGNTWVQQTKITASDADTSDFFGRSVAISGNLAFVGAYGNDDGESTSGSAYLFANTSGNIWVEQAKITAPDPANNDRFGEAVAISGNIAIAGARYNDDEGSNAGSAYIIDLETPIDPSVNLFLNDGTATESGITTGSLTVALSSTINTSTNVKLSLSGSSSNVLGDDFSLTGTNLTWNGGSEIYILIPSGSNTGTLTLTPTDDNLVEGDEVATFTLTDGTGYTHSNDNVTIDISDNDTPSLSIVSNDNSATEDSTTSGNFLITFDQDPVVSTTFNLALSGTTSTTSGTDFTLSGTGLTWNSGTSASVVVSAGTNSVLITLSPIDDSIVESNETLTLTLADGTNYNHSSDSATVTITDNDIPTATITATDSSSSEENNETGSITITLSQSPVNLTTVNLIVSGLASTINGTDNSLSGTGLTWAGGATATVEFSAGISSRTLTLTPIDDTAAEGDETFILTLDNGTDYNHTNDSATITIIDNDNTNPVITEGSSVSVTMSEDSNPTPFSLTLNATDANNDTLTWSIATSPNNGSATTSGTGSSKTITYTPNNDYNGNDSFVVQVSDGSATDTITVNVTINSINDAPVILQGSNLTVHLSEDSTITLSSDNISVNDIDNDQLTWTLSSNASQGNITTVTTSANNLENVVYSPNLNYNGSDSFVLQVSDGVATDNITINLTINAVNDAPVVTTPSTQNLSPGDTLNLSILATDIDGDELSLRFLDAARSWVNISGTTLNGIVPDFEAGQDLSFRLGVSDGTTTTEIFVKLDIEASENNENNTIERSTLSLSVTSSANLPIEGAKVQLFGQQLYYTDSEGKVSLSLSDQVSTVLEVSANGFLPSSINIPAGSLEASVILETANLTLSGFVNLSDSENPFGTIVAATSHLGTLETEVEGDGSFSLSLPTGATTWTFGAALEGYTSSTVLAITTSTNTEINQNFSLSKDTQLSWKSNQDGPGDPVTIWITSNPPFVTGDEATAQLSVSEGSASAVDFDAVRAALSFTISPPTDSNNVQIDFSAKPSSGILRNLNIDIALAQSGDEQQNLHFFQQFSHVSGTQGQITLTGLDEEQEDLSGLEIPAFGVSSNVEAIRMERVQGSTSNDNPVYSIDAYLIDDATGTLTLLDNSEIIEIYLTFSYDPDNWNPLRNQVLYSEDGGVTWHSVPSEDIVSVDSIRNTVTIRSDHLSLWTLSELEGLFGNSGGSSGGGGGCLLK